MYINPKEKIFGLPAINIRNLLRDLSHGLWTVDAIKEKLGVTNRKANEILNQLASLDYIKLKHVIREEELWETTLKGSSFGLASAALPVSRTTANRVVNEFLDRVRRVNADPYYLFRVKKVVVFGSYISEKDKLNDVDIGICLEPKETDHEKHMALCRERSRLAEQQGRRFNNLIDRLFWADEEVRLVLKARSRTISLHQDDPILKIVETKTLFEEG